MGARNSSVGVFVLAGAAVLFVCAGPVGARDNMQSNAAESTVDLHVSPDIAGFVLAIAPATAAAKIGGSDQRHEKYVALARRADGEIIVTAVGVGEPEELLEPRVIAIVRVR